MDLMTFFLGLLVGVALTVVVIALMVRGAANEGREKVGSFHERANALLQERNQISREQLRLMKVMHEHQITGGRQA